MHPFHTLPIILALANSDADENVQGQTNSRKLSNAEDENDRTKAAKEIIQMIHSSKNNGKSIKFYPIFIHLDFV